MEMKFGGTVRCVAYFRLPTFMTKECLMPILKCTGLVKVYGRSVRAVDGIDFDVEPGEIVGLVGPNGAGKSTTFSIACGLTSPTKGRVFLNGQEVTNWPMYKRARHGMGYLPQDKSSFVKLTVEENLLAILEYLPVNRKERYIRMNRLIEQFGLEDKRKQVSSTLSGGERRRLEIARCLSSEPKIILLDEPFNGIDPTTIDDIQDIIGDLRDSGIAILITDHRQRETLTITDRTFVIVEGKVLVSGDIHTVLNDPEVYTKYFGQRLDKDSILKEKENFLRRRQEAKAQREGTADPASVIPNPHIRLLTSSSGEAVRETESAET